MPKSKRIWGSLDPFFESGPVLGRKVANIRFLGALLEKDPFDEYHLFLLNKGLRDSVEKHVRKIAPGIMESGRFRMFDRQQLPNMLATTDYHCFHLSDCITSQPLVARLRNRYSRAIFPVTGIIHSLSYSDFGNAFLRHMWPGTTGRDAIVCTSTLGMEAVANFFAWLREGYGLKPETHPAPQLSRIPLGVDTGVCRPVPGSDGGPVRLLVFGRISHHSKMDLVPLIRALHRLVRDGMAPASVELVLAGWVDDDDKYLDTLKGMAANVGIPLTVHARPDEGEKVRLFQSADVFVSIADNPQETFGITLAEAASFGLPTIASEYDGYRDIVVHGGTGLLVPTVGPASTPDVDDLSMLVFDNQYHLLLAQRTVVSIPALAEALKRLIDDPALRRAMGDAARRRAVETYDWKAVIDGYVRLWEELWKNPANADSVRNLAHPQNMPFGRLFGHYTSRTLSPETLVVAGRTGEAFYRGRDFPTIYAGLGDTIDPEVAKKLVFLARKSIDTGTLMRKLTEVAPGMDTDQINNHILWALKHDILELA